MVSRTVGERGGGVGKGGNLFKRALYYCFIVGQKGSMEIYKAHRLTQKMGTKHQ